MTHPVYLMRLFTTSVLLCLAISAAHAESSVENLFRNAKFASATLSPNGKYLATTANINGRMQLAVVEIETGTAKNAAGYETMDVNGIQWINDERLVFNIVDRDGEQRSSSSGLYAINRDGTKSATLMLSWEHLRGMDQGTWTSEPRYMNMLARSVNDDPNAIIAVGYRVNSYQATQFRIWATKTLREFIIKGFVLDDERLKQGKRVLGKDYISDFDREVKRIEGKKKA